MALRYLRYRAVASSRYAVHSPFMYDLVTGVIDVPARPLDAVERLRRQALRSRDVIDAVDFGASGDGRATVKKPVAAMIRRYAKPVKYAALLHRLVARFRPDTVLELGTSLGISTMYLAAGNPAARVTTLEGCPATAARAADHFRQGGFGNIRGVTGPFDDTLPAVLDGMAHADFVFFDGNHKREPTLRYFGLCKAKSSGGSVFVFDDINWSPGMRSAWQAIREDPTVTATVDLFMMGIAFFNTDLHKQDFVIRF